MTSVCVGMLGAGFIGQMHSLAFSGAGFSSKSPRLTARLKTIVDTRADPARQVQERFQWERVASDWSEIVTDKEIRLFINAGPNDAHFDSVVAASAAGKDVFCEKPLARTADEAFELWQKVEANGVRHMCAYAHRFVPALQLARQMILAGEFGEIRHFRSNLLLNMLEPGGLTWRFRTSAAGGGSSGDLGSHHIDQARFLVGEVTSVTAATRTWSTSPEGSDDVNDDWFLAAAELEQGATAAFEATRVAPGQANTGRIEVDGTKGTISWGAERVSELRITEPHKGHRILSVVAREHPYSDFWLPVGIQGAFAVGWRDAFYYQARHMLSAVALGDPVAPIAATFKDGYRVAEIVDSILKSAKTGHRERVVFREV